MYLTRSTLTRACWWCWWLYGHTLPSADQASVNAVFWNNNTTGKLRLNLSGRSRWNFEEVTSENRAHWQKGYTIDFSHSHKSQQRYLETVATMKAKGTTCKKLSRRKAKQKAWPVYEKLFRRVALSSHMAVTIIQLGSRFTSWVHPISISTISGCIAIKSGADVHSTFMLPRGEANTAILTCLWPQLCPALAANWQILITLYTIVRWIYSTTCLKAFGFLSFSAG